MVEVTLVGPMAEAAGTRKTEAEAATVGELIEALTARYGALFKQRARGSRIVLNGTPIQFKKGHKTALADGDEVAFLVPIGGG
jgi:molybdopterin converting factor small subunit